MKILTTVWITLLIIFGNGDVLTETDPIDTTPKVKTVAPVRSDDQHSPIESIEPIEPIPMIEVEGEPVETEVEEVSSDTELVSLGEFLLTAYCSCESCCDQWAYNRPVDEAGNPIVYTASGEVARQGYTIAVDTSVIPFGTEVIIDDQVYMAQDRGGAIKQNRIDVYFANHKDALIFGRKTSEVFIKVAN